MNQMKSPLNQRSVYSHSDGKLIRTIKDISCE